MEQLENIKVVRRLADKLGTRLICAEFVGDGIRFTYDGMEPREYSDPDVGITEEIKRLKRFLSVEI